jgi:hypothetical protein
MNFWFIYFSFFFATAKKEFINNGIRDANVQNTITAKQASKPTYDWITQEAKLHLLIYSLNQYNSRQRVSCNPSKTNQQREELLSLKSTTADTNRIDPSRYIQGIPVLAT